jgi:hypothetical protein
VDGRDEEELGSADLLMHERIPQEHMSIGYGVLAWRWVGYALYQEPGLR